MVNLGQQLTTQDGANIVYNAKNKWFECMSVEEPNEESLRVSLSNQSYKMQFQLKYEKV